MRVEFRLVRSSGNGLGVAQHAVKSLWSRFDHSNIRRSEIQTASAVETSTMARMRADGCATIHVQIDPLEGSD